MSTRLASAILAVLAVVSAAAAQTQEIKGKVVRAGKEYLLIVVEGTHKPKVGDTASVYLVLPGVDAVASVATGEVVEVGEEDVMVKVLKNTAVVRLGHLVSFASTGTLPADPVPARPVEPMVPEPGHREVTPQQFNNELTAITKELRKIGRTFGEAVRENPRQVGAAYEELMRGFAQVKAKADRIRVSTAKESPRLWSAFQEFMRNQEQMLHRQMKLSALDAVSPQGLIEAIQEERELNRLREAQADYAEAHGFKLEVGPTNGGATGTNPENPLRRTIVPSREGTREISKLDRADATDAGRDPGGKSSGSFCKVYDVRMVPGKVYTIDMTGPFDTYLRLVNSRGEEVARDDDGGEGLNAQIVFRPSAVDNYRIVCTSYGPGVTGDFTLSVRENGSAPEPGPTN